MPGGLTRSGRSWSSSRWPASSTGSSRGPAPAGPRPQIIACFAVAAAGLAALIGYEPRRAEPLIDLRFFRSAPFSGATLIAVSAFAALGGFLLLNTLYLQNVRGFSALHAGLYTVPMAAMTIIFAPLSGRIVGSRGPRLPLLVAGLGITASGVMLTRLTATTSIGWLIAAYIVFGIGFGVVNAPITNTAVSGMPRSPGRGRRRPSPRPAARSAPRWAWRSSARSSVSALAGPFRTAFPAASHPGWWIVAGCGCAVLVLGQLTSGRWARGTARRTAEALMPAAPQVPVGTS